MSKKAERRWTVMVVPHGSGTSRTRGVSRGAGHRVRALNEAYGPPGKQGGRAAAAPSIMPTRGWITSAFASMRVPPILPLGRPHEGIDGAAKAGGEIEAPAAGIVTD